MMKKIKGALTNAERYLTDIWQRATRISRASSSTIPHSLMIPAINDMIDVVTSRDAARLARVPILLFVAYYFYPAWQFDHWLQQERKKNDWIVYLFIQ